MRSIRFQCFSLPKRVVSSVKRVQVCYNWDILLHGGRLSALRLPAARFVKLWKPAV